MRMSKTRKSLVLFDQIKYFIFFFLAFQCFCSRTIDLGSERFIHYSNVTSSYFEQQNKKKNTWTWKCEFFFCVIGNQFWVEHPATLAKIGTWSSVLFQLDQMIFEVFGVILGCVWKSTKKNNSMFCRDLISFLHWIITQILHSKLQTLSFFFCFHLFLVAFFYVFSFVVSFSFSNAHIVDDCHLNDMLTVRWIILEFMVRD